MPLDGARRRRSTPAPPLPAVASAASSDSESDSESDTSSASSSSGETSSSDHDSESGSGSSSESDGPTVCAHTKNPGSNTASSTAGESDSSSDSSGPDTEDSSSSDSSSDSGSDTDSDAPTPHAFADTSDEGSPTPEAAPASEGATGAVSPTPPPATVPYQSSAEVHTVIGDDGGVTLELLSDDETTARRQSMADWASGSDTDEDAISDTEDDEDPWLAVKPDIPTHAPDKTPLTQLRGGTRDNPVWHEIRWHDKTAQGRVEGLNRINQDQTGERLSRSGHVTFNCNVVGDFSVQIMHRMSDPDAGGIDRALAPVDTALQPTANQPELQPTAAARADARMRARASGPNLQIVPGCLLIDRNRLSSDDDACEMLDISGRVLAWRRTTDHLTFPSSGRLLFDAEFYHFAGTVHFLDGRTEEWRGTRSRYFGKMQQYGQYSQHQTAGIPREEAAMLPFPPANAPHASKAETRTPPPVDPPRILHGVHELWFPHSVEKLRRHQADCETTYAALYELFKEKQGPPGSDPIPLNLDEPKVRDLMKNRPEWVCLTQDDQLPHTRDVMWDLSKVDAAGNGEITEIQPGTPVHQFLKVDQITEMQQRLRFIDEAAVSQHASHLGLDDHCHTWKHKLSDGSPDRRDWRVSLSDHHKGFYTFLGLIMDTYADDVHAKFWQDPSPFPPTCPFTFVPANSVIKRKPPMPGTEGPGALKVRRSADLRFPWQSKRDAFFAHYGFRAPLAYNADCPLPAKPTRSARHTTAAERQVLHDPLHPTRGPCGVPPKMPDPRPAGTGSAHIMEQTTEFGTGKYQDAAAALRSGKTTHSGASQAWKADQGDAASPPRVDMLTRHDLGQMIVILWSLGLEIFIHAADLSQYFRQFAIAIERRGLSGAFIRSRDGTWGYSVACSLDYGAKDNPLKTSRAGDMVTHYIDHMLAQVGDSITWPESVQQRLDAREVLLGLFHARVAKSAMFVDDIIVVGIIDAAKALPLASKEILESGLGEDLGYNTELKKLQTGGAIAEYVGLKLRVDAPLAEAPPIGINLPAWKADAYIAQLQELQDDDHVWIDLQAVEQISGRMVHASSVWAEILLTLGPIYEMIYAQVADLKYKHKRRRTQAAAQAFADCEAIIQRNSPRPFFPSVRRLPIGAPELGVGFSDVSKPGEDGPVPGIDHFVGFWCALPDGRVLYGSILLTHEQLDLPVSTLEFIGCVWAMQAMWPYMAAQGAQEYRSVTDSLAAVLKSKNSRSIATSMESAHRMFDTYTRSFANKATMDFFYREDNELADLLSHGPPAYRAFLQLLHHEGFTGEACDIGADTEYASIEHILRAYAADVARINRKKAAAQRVELTGSGQRTRPPRPSLSALRTRRPSSGSAGPRL